MGKPHNILGCNVDAITMAETLDRVLTSIKEGRNLRHVVVNAAKLVKMQTDSGLFHAVTSSDLINVDGQGVVWGLKLLKTPVPERVAGIDIMFNLVKLAHQENLKVFFLGATEDVVQKVVDRFSKEYSSKIVAGFHHGYFGDQGAEDVSTQISKSKAHILFVAMGSPHKEKFLEKYQDKMNVPFVMGVGGSFDVAAGKVNRAPTWMIKMGLEWFYRLLQEPFRLGGRYLSTNTSFIYLVLKQKFGFYHNPWEN